MTCEKINSEEMTQAGRTPNKRVISGTKELKQVM